MLHELATGRFAAELTDLEVLGVVGRVARAVNPDNPEQLSQPRFDQHVAAHPDEFQGVPTARAIYMRLNSGDSGRVTWRSIVRGACAAGASAQQTLVAGARSASPVALSDRLVFFALTLVAGRLAVRTLSPGEYDSERDRLRMLDRRRGGVLATLLPTAAQLSQHAGGWDEALEIAGLQPRPKAFRPKQAPASTAVSIVEALGLYLEHQGSLATRRDLRAFAADAGFSLADDTDRPWPQFIAEFRDRWEQRGRWCPPASPHHTKRIRYPVDPTDFAGLPPRQRGRWSDIDACATSVLAYWQTLPARREPTQRGYGQWAVGKPHPAPNRFAQHGGFTAVKERARALRRQTVTPRA